MNELTNLMNSLDGYKTYIVGFMMICIGVYTNDNEMILQGVGLITLRVGVKKVERIIDSRSK